MKQQNSAICTMQEDHAPCSQKSAVAAEQSAHPRRCLVAFTILSLVLLLLAIDFQLFRSDSSFSFSEFGTADCYLGIMIFGLAAYGLQQTRQRKAPSAAVSVQPRTRAVAAAPLTEEQRVCNAIEQTARKSGITKAGQVLVDFEKRHENPAPAGAYDHMIRACNRANDSEGAHLWFSRMASKGVDPSVSIYNYMLDVCGKVDGIVACEKLLCKMIERGAVPNVVSYSMVISGRARRGEKDHAMYWLERMTTAGIEPDAVCYNSLIHACSVQGDVISAEKLVREMQTHGIKATVTTYTTIIDACAKSGQIASAEVWMGRMVEQDLKPNVVSFCAVIDACAKSLDPARAVYWHEKMIKFGISPNPHSYSAVINAFAQVGDVPSAEAWLTRAEDANCTTGEVVVYSSVLGACAKAGDQNRALAVYNRMRAKGIKPHIVAFAALARTFAYKGDWIQVESIAADMAADGVVSNEFFAYAQLLSYATAKPKQDARAEAYFRAIVRRGVPINDHIVTALAKGLGHDRATNLMNEMGVPPPPARQARRGGHPNGRERVPHDHGR